MEEEECHVSKPFVVISVLLLAVPKIRHGIRNSLNSVAKYQPLQPEYVLVPYLSAFKGFKNRKLISRFRCGCHGLHVDTGRLLLLAQPLGSNVIVFSALLVQ